MQSSVFPPANGGRPYHVLLPLADLTHADLMLSLARAFAEPRGGRITALCIVGVPSARSLSVGAIEARQRRQMLEKLAGLVPDAALDIRPLVRVSHEVWQGIDQVAAEEQVDLLLLDWKGYSHTPERIFGRTIDEIMDNPPCDVVVFKPGPLPPRPRILLPVRGGPYAELALSLAESLADVLDGQITIMHAVPPAVPSHLHLPSDRPFAEFVRHASGQPRVRRTVTVRGDVPQAILGEAARHDLLIMGASALAPLHPALGSLAETMAGAVALPILVVKTRAPTPLFFAQPAPADISTVVDKWFAENTFHAREFRHIAQLVELKQRQNLTISLGLPALNEEATIGPIIKAIKRELMEKAPLLDEIVLIDSASTDGTAEIARSLGIPVYNHPDILPEQGTYTGKGEALWKSLHVLQGDIVAWIDTDIANIHPKFVYGVIGPLLKEPRIKYVKGFYRRPLRSSSGIEAHGGGRVTELTARPLFNLFFPELSGIIQPLSGEYAGRREVLERLPFFTGYGIETGLLIDLVQEYGLSALAQVDLQERIHRNQTLLSLSRMSFVIIQVIMRRLEQRDRLHLAEDLSRSMKQIHYQRNRLHLDVKDLSDVERPPIITLPAYRAGRGERAADAAV